MDLDSLRAEVDAGDGVVTTDLETLRKAYGAGRLSPGVVDNIRTALAERGLGLVYNPGSRMSQWDKARVYDRTTPIGRVIEAAHAVGETHDDVLRGHIDQRPADQLEQIRRIVCS